MDTSAYMTMIVLLAGVPITSAEKRLTTTNLAMREQALLVRSARAAFVGLFRHHPAQVHGTTSADLVKGSGNTTRYTHVQLNP